MKAEFAILAVKGADFLRKYFLDRSVRTESGCLEWTGSRNHKGYGITGFRCFSATRTCNAHRLVFLLNQGRLTPGLTIDHLCGNRACIEPSHLDECSNTENNRRSPNTWVGKGIRKTHCPQGHPLVEGNLVPAQLRRGSRACLTCNRERTRIARLGRLNAAR